MNNCFDWLFFHIFEDIKNSGGFVFVILPHIENVEREIFLSNWSFGRFLNPIFTNLTRAKTMLARYEHEFFSSNCGNFAVECDWNSKISQNVQNLFFFQKNR